MTLKEQIQDFLQSPQKDFDLGLTLLSQVMPNAYYLHNIRLKGERHGMSSLVYELTKRVTSLPANKVSVIERVTKVSGVTKVDRPPTPSTTPKGISLRQRYPFLSSVDCPQELKILVNDMITSHQKVVSGHERLYEVAHKPAEKCFEAAREVVEHYLNNRLIWKEMDYYHNHGKVLGQHPVFERLQRERQLVAMTPEALVEIYRLLPRRINHLKDKIRQFPQSAAQGDRTQRLDQMEWELNRLKQLLMIKDKPMARNANHKKSKTQKK